MVLFGELTPLFLYKVFYLHVNVDELPGCFHTLVTMNSGALNMSVTWKHAHLESLEYLPRSGIVGPIHKISAACSRWKACSFVCPDGFLVYFIHRIKWSSLCYWLVRAYMSSVENYGKGRGLPGCSALPLLFGRVGAAGFVLYSWSQVLQMVNMNFIYIKFKLMFKKD